MSRNPREQFDPRPKKKFLQYEIEKTGPGTLDPKKIKAEVRKIGQFLHGLTDEMGDEAYTFDSFFDVDPLTNTAILTPVGRQCIDHCDLIIAHHADRHCDELVFGFDRVREIVRGNGWKKVTPMRVAVTDGTNEFRQLVDAVRSVKGSVDWREDSKDVHVCEDFDE